jgi:DNA-directed RNA polymerase specialized sigma24 family protein
MSAVTFLIGQFKKGHSSAFEVLFERFFAYPFDLARRRGGRKYPIPHDNEDIAQLVFWELYRTVREKRPMGRRLCNTASLLTALATLTHQQVRRQWRDHTRQCRDSRRSRLASDLVAKGGGNPLDEFVDDTAFGWLREVESLEAIEQLLFLLPSEKYRTLVQCLMQGHGKSEVADTLDCSVRAVERYLVEIRTIWQRHPVGQEILSRHSIPHHG